MKPTTNLLAAAAGVPRLPRRPAAAGALLAMVGVALGLCPSASGQGSWSLPEPIPVAIDNGDFALGSTGSPPPGWSERYWVGSTSDWDVSSVEPSCAGGRWGQHALETAALGGTATVLVSDQSALESPLDWTNFRMEFDFQADSASQVGVVIGGRGGDTPGSVIQEGYLFVIQNIPTETQAVNEGVRSMWRFFRRVGGLDTELGRSQVVLDDPIAGARTVYDGCYRLRVEFFCGNLRIQVQGLDGSGCDDGWCTILEWSDPSPVLLTPGFVGLYHGGTDPTSPGSARFDNVAVATWGTDCFAICEPWTDWDDAEVQPVPFKYLYEGALLDYSYGISLSDRKIDLATEAPVLDPRGTQLPTGYCNGWQLLVDLPPPTSAGANADEVRAFLEPMHAAVQYGDQGAGFEFFDSFDQDPASATYNPIPVVTDGATPIANALYDAYEWFLEKRTGETSLWASDPLARCRSWYVFLITDGEESCARASDLDPPTLDLVCQPGEAAQLFAAAPNPTTTNDPGIPVFTIGFAGDVADVSSLDCIAAASDKNFFETAADAEQLQEKLTSIINQLEERTRTFAPFKISPPPSSSGGGGEQRDYLTVFPFFSPNNDSTIWNGKLYAFRLNEDNPTLPATADTCEIDFSQVLWESADVLTGQLAAGYSRKVFYADKPAAAWVRRDLRDVTLPANVDLRTDFATSLSVAGAVSDDTVQEIVNFVRNERRTDLSAAVGPARPDNVSVLGDIYHSQPLIVGPPNNPAFYYDYGFGASGASDYRLFANKHAQRRRVVLAGANDGLLHAFDGGYFDRDAQGQSVDPPVDLYTDQHDLGTGAELFTFLPNGVNDKLWMLTYGGSADFHQYMVDGRITASDFLLDHDGNVGTDPIWRTAVITTLRRGGRSLVALDVTQPDPVTGFDDSDATSIGEVAPWQSDGSTDLPGCFDGATADCDGEYPKVLWEFTDTADADVNGEPDLGWSWSKPAIARLAIHNASVVDEPGSRFVAFFGGGYDNRDQGADVDATGNFAYAVDLATGVVIHKYLVGSMVPGSFRALDSDLDGFHDRVYFASEGSIWRIDVPGPLEASADGTVSDTDYTRIFDFRTDLPQQLFFMEPITVPALFDGVTYTWGLAIGSGDRADLGRESADPLDPQINHFFFVLDDGQSSAKGIADLDAFSYTSLPNLSSDPDTQPDVPASCASTSLNPAAGKYGWYMALRPDEKVNFEATVIDGYINFPTFEPGLGKTATDPPDVCGDGSGAGGGAGVDPVDLDGDGVPDENPEAVCTAAGIGRVYKLWYECAIAGDSGFEEINDMITGQEAYTIGGVTYNAFTPSTTNAVYTWDYHGAPGYTITNWRQN